MRRVFQILSIVLLLTIPSYSTSYKEHSLTELVGWSDIIVVAAAHKQSDHAYTLSVSNTLLGVHHRELSLSVVDDGEAIRSRQGRYFIYFLTQKETQLTLVYPLAFEPLVRLNEIRDVVEMRTSLHTFFNDPKYASSPDFLEMLGMLLHEKDSIDSISRDAAIVHLHDMLKKTDKNILLKTICALRDVNCKDPAAIIPFLEHPDYDIRRISIQYLAWAPDRAAVAPLCRLIDGMKDHSIEREIGIALIAIGDPSAVPALERATQQGVFGGISAALGHLGNEHSFEILLNAVETKDAMAPVSGLITLVQRSNKTVEPWMLDNRWTKDAGLVHKKEWGDWWQRNKTDFKIIKTKKG